MRPPEPDSVLVAPAVGRVDQVPGVPILTRASLVPSAAHGRHGVRWRVVVRSPGHPAGVLGSVIKRIWIAFTGREVAEVIDRHPFRLAPGLLFLASGLEAWLPHVVRAHPRYLQRGGSGRDRGVNRLREGERFENHPNCRAVRRRHGEIAVRGVAPHHWDPPAMVQNDLPRRRWATRPRYAVGKGTGAWRTRLSRQRNSKSARSMT